MGEPMRAAVGAQVQPYPASFHTRRVSTNGVTLYVRVGGKARRSCCFTATARPAICGRRWPAAGEATTRSSCRICAAWACLPAGRRLRQEDPGPRHCRLLDALEIAQGRPCHPRYRQHGRLRVRSRAPDRVRRFVLMDAPLPGVGPWDDIVKSHALWHFSFWGPDAERLVDGRERIYLDRFWNEFSATRTAFPEAHANTMPRCTRGPARCMPVRAVPGVRSGRHRQQGVCRAGQLTMPFSLSAARSRLVR